MTDSVPLGGPDRQRFVMATLVAAHGTVPMPPGARLFVGGAGAISGSVTVGGCVDTEVIGAAEQMFATGESLRVMTIELSDVESEALGIGCGGSVDVLLERFESDGAALLDTLDRINAAGKSAARVARLTGAPAQLAWDGEGFVAGAMDDEGFKSAARAAVIDPPIGSGVVEVEGEKLFVDLWPAHDTLIIVGANEVGAALAALAGTQGYRTVVIDARERFASDARFPHDTELRVGIPSEIVSSILAGWRAHVALVVHDHKIEIPVLARVLTGDCGYVGLLGGRKRTTGVLDVLRERGVPEDRIARIKTPIGLDIGARTSAEIALSIVAELLAYRQGKLDSWGRDG